MFRARSVDGAADEGEVPHVPHRGAVGGPHQRHGGDQHALPDHQTLRPLPVPHQRHILAVIPLSLLYVMRMYVKCVSLSFTV